MEPFTTLEAEERLFPCMDALVNLYVTLIDEPLATVRAGEGLFFNVAFHVLFQLLFVLELNATAATEMEL